MAASLSGVFNLQNFTNLGDLGDGMRLYTYAPSTTTHKIAYTDVAGTISHTYTSDGSGGLYIALDARGELSAPLFLTAGGYDLALKTAAGATTWTRRAYGTAEAVDTLRADLASSTDVAKGDALIGVKQPFTGAVARTQHAKNQEFVSVKDFGAVGTADPSNETLDTAAFLAAIAASDTVYIPDGSYYLSTRLVLGNAKRLIGASRARTKLYFSGAGTEAIFCGDTTTDVNEIDISGFTLNCTNDAIVDGTFAGIRFEHINYFTIDNVSVVGPFDVVAADVLKGYGFHFSKNAIIGRISHCGSYIWKYGFFFETTAATQSDWTAALALDGQGEAARCSVGVVVGNPTINFYSGVGLAIRDFTIQECYGNGMVINSGDNTIVDSCYFEGNANYDLVLGATVGSGAPAPIGCKIINNTFSSEDIAGGVTPYGTTPYLAKVKVKQGALNKIRDNNMSISTAIPLVIVDVAATDTSITGNRLNSTAATTARISNASTTTITADNAPEAPRVATRSTTRLLNAASGDVSYTGVGFRPTEIEFFAAVDTSPAASFGAADASDSVRNRCISTDTSGVNLSSADCIRIIKDSAGNEQKAVLKSFDSDGFTLTWTLVGAPPGNTLVVNYVARR